MSGRNHDGEKTPGTRWTIGWVDLRAGLDTDVRGKILLPLPGIELPSPGRQVRSQTILTELPRLLNLDIPYFNLYSVVVT
jgi:hypothetical protein